MSDWRYRVVEAVLNKISSADKWSRWHEALDNKLQPCETNHLRAVKFSLRGALQECFEDLAPVGEGYAEGWYMFNAWLYGKVEWRSLEEQIECDKCKLPFTIDLLGVSPEDVVIETFERFNGAFGVQYTHIRQLLEGVLQSEHTD